MGKSLSIFKLGSSIRHYLHLHYEYISKEELEVYSDTYFFQIVIYVFLYTKKLGCLLMTSEQTSLVSELV